MEKGEGGKWGIISRYMEREREKVRWNRKVVNFSVSLFILPISPSLELSLESSLSLLTLLSLSLPGSASDILSLH